MRTLTVGALKSVALLTLALCFPQPAAAAEHTWRYRGQITSSDYPHIFPVGAPVSVHLTVDPDLQVLVRATVTLNGFVFALSGGNPFIDIGVEGYNFYASATPSCFWQCSSDRGVKLGGFTPFFGTFVGRSIFPPPFSDTPFHELQSFVFFESRSAFLGVGASGLTLEAQDVPVWGFGWLGFR